MMNCEKVMKIFRDTAYVHTGGTDEELRAANYLKDCCAEMGLEAHLETFEVQMATMKKAVLTVDGKEIECKGYLNSGCAEVEAPLFYMPTTDKFMMSQVKGKIVLLDTGMGRWTYQDLIDNGAVGFITYDGNANYVDFDIDQKELRAHVRAENPQLPGVNINVKSAIGIVDSDANVAKIVLEQDEYVGESRNVVMDMPGEIDEVIVFTAHYDTTSLSQGAYDNMSGCIGLLGIAEYFLSHPHRYGLRFIFCGSEERGLLGSKAYVAAHEEELAKVAMNINLDMIGCIMGRFIACCTSENELVGYVNYLGLEKGFQVAPYQDVYSSDSTPFADKGIPAISFARAGGGTIHNSYDTIALMKAERMLGDIAFICAFSDRMANAVRCPVKREMPDNMKEKLDKYLLRKR